MFTVTESNLLLVVLFLNLACLFLFALVVIGPIVYFLFRASRMVSEMSDDADTFWDRGEEAHLSPPQSRPGLEEYPPSYEHSPERRGGAA